MATRFKDFTREIEAEARAEGPEAVAEIEALRAHFRIGRQLAQARQAERLSQAQVAARVGIDQADVSDLERGAANPTLTKLDAVAAFFGLQVELGKRRGVTPPREPRKGRRRPQIARAR